MFNNAIFGEVNYLNLCHEVVVNLSENVHSTLFTCYLLLNMVKMNFFEGNSLG